VGWGERIDGTQFQPSSLRKQGPITIGRSCRKKVVHQIVSITTAAAYGS
jgi:hypothetical protein